MSTVDTIQILLEADSRGLETQLKRGMSSVTSFIDEMNSQEVNWQKILAGSLDTAIIAGIASSFALAIEQAVQFQSSLMNLNNSAAGVSAATAGNLGGVSDAMVNLAGQTGSSLGDVTAAFEAMFKQTDNNQAATALTGLIGQIAQESGQKLATLMPIIVQLFNQWGITTLPQATDALTGLVNAAGEGKFSLDELIQVISTQGPILQTKTNVSDLAIQLQQLSNISTLSKGSIEDAFNAISSSVANPLSNMNLLAGTAAAFNGPDGLINSFQKLATFMKNAGGVAQTFGQQMGLAAGTTSQLGTTATTSFKAAATAADVARAHLTPLQVILDAHKTTLQQLQDNWSYLLALLTKDIGIPFLEKLSTALKDVDNLIEDITNKDGPKLFKDFGSIAQGVAGSSSQAIGNTGLSMLQIIGSAFGISGDKVAGGITSLFSNGLLGLNTGLPNGGTGLGSAPPTPSTNPPAPNTSKSSATSNTINIYAGGANAAPSTSRSPSGGLGNILMKGAQGLLADIGL